MTDNDNLARQVFSRILSLSLNSTRATARFDFFHTHTLVSLHRPLAYIKYRSASVDGRCTSLPHNFTQSEGQGRSSADEVEALSAIYGDEWCVIDASSHIYCISIADNMDSPKWRLSLQVHMPENYPLESPPEYQINAAWLRGAERIALEDKLSDIYCDNMGEDLIFLWVEGVREFLQEKADRDNPGESDRGRMIVQSTETATEEDEFDTSVLGDLASLTFDRVIHSTKSVPCPEIIHGETLTDRKSTFQPHLARVTDKAQIPLVLKKLLENKKVANATHNILAYRIVTESGPVYQGCDDDGETNAGSRMLHLLQIMNVENVMVVVSRWYGGIHLGADRFRHINNCTRQILESNGFIQDKEDKKGPKSGKKSR